MSELVVVRIRGQHDLTEPMKRTLDMLRLTQKHACVILSDTPTTRGQLNKVKDYVTWGIIDAETKKSLVSKRGVEYKARTTDTRGKITYKKFIEVDGKKLKPTFRLNPPKGGFERKGIKVSFRAGGVLGDRKEKINELIQKMI